MTHSALGCTTPIGRCGPTLLRCPVNSFRLAEFASVARALLNITGLAFEDPRALGQAAGSPLSSAPPPVWAETSTASSSSSSSCSSPAGGGGGGGEGGGVFGGLPGAPPPVLLRLWGLPNGCEAQAAAAVAARCVLVRSVYEV